MAEAGPNPHERIVAPIERPLAAGQARDEAEVDRRDAVVRRVAMVRDGWTGRRRWQARAAWLPAERQAVA